MNLRVRRTHLFAFSGLLSYVSVSQHWLQRQNRWICPKTQLNKEYYEIRTYATSTFANCSPAKLMKRQQTFVSRGETKFTSWWTSEKFYQWSRSDNQQQTRKPSSAWFTSCTTSNIQRVTPIFVHLYSRTCDWGLNPPAGNVGSCLVFPLCDKTRNHRNTGPFENTFVETGNTE